MKRHHAPAVGFIVVVLLIDMIAQQVAKSARRPRRDATIARLEERVRVLERVVADEGARVSREIEQLRST